jgi:hypothetical protein
VPFDGAYPSYVIRVSSNAHGVVSGEGLDCRGSGPVCEVSFSTPATMTLTATPDPGYIFAGLRFRGLGSQSTQQCLVDYNAMIDQVRIQDDVGNWGLFTSFGAGTLSNSFCTLDLAQSSAAPSGTNLTLTLRLAFTPAFTSLRLIDMRADSNSGSTSGWIQRGNFSVTP